MNVSAVFIRRPVMTTLVMLAIVIFGIIGFRQLPINNLPRVDFPTISVQANLPGANPETMATTVATVLERQFTTIAGIDSMNSSSSTGATSITMQFNLNRSIEAAAQDVQTAISAAIPLLPPMPTRPFFRKVNPSDFPILYLQLASDTLPTSKVDEYAETLVAQRISMVDGVAQVQVYGSQKFAVRVQVDPNKLAAKGIGIDQVASAIRTGTVKLPTGSLYGKKEFYNVQANDQLMNAAAFRPLIVSVRNGIPIRLGNLGRVLDDVENNLVSNFTMRGRAITLAVQRQPDTNTVQVIDDIKALLPALRAEIPQSVSLNILFDKSISIRESVRDVEITLGITAVLVVLVIFLFLRNTAATIIPSMSLPTSLIGTFAVMALLNFSLDDLSLMALTLCVGFVVDDAIVVLENIVRHLEMGEKPLEAAYHGSREVSFTIISMTLSLVAVFIPILFLGGLIGRVFNEFAVTITIAILISGFVSLSLTPMLCSRFLRHSHGSVVAGPIGNALESGFNAILSLYDYFLVIVLRHRRLTLLFSIALVFVTGWLLVICPKGFIPGADTGAIFGNTEASQSISFADMKRHQGAVSKIVSKDENVENFMSAVGSGGASSSMNSGRVFIVLKPRADRKLSADQVIQELRRKITKIPGIKLYMQNPQSIRIGGQSSKGQYQVTLQGTDFRALYGAVDVMAQKLASVAGIQDPTPDVQRASLQAQVEVDREKAYALGLTAKQVEDALSFAYGTSQVAQIYTADNEYKVILEVEPEFLAGPNVMDQLYVRARSGKLVPLSAFARIEIGTSALTVTHLGQLPSATISFNLLPNMSLGEAMKAVQEIARTSLPSGVTASPQGNAQAFQKALKDMGGLLIVAILFIYIVLGILYESFAHPFTILTGLPSAGLGAVLTLMLFGRELDVYGFLGLIMLIGIVKKNAIMMIDHALEVERNHGKSPEESIHEACLVRFRPITMTTVAALMGSIPLATGLGAGGEARQPLGLAVVGGLMVSQLLTLFITPVIYIYVDHWSTYLSGRRRPAKLSRVMKWTGKK